MFEVDDRGGLTAALDRSPSFRATFRSCQELMSVGFPDSLDSFEGKMIIRIHCICGPEQEHRELLLLHLRTSLKGMNFKWEWTHSGSTRPGDDAEHAEDMLVTEAQIVIVLFTAGLDDRKDVRMALRRHREGFLRIIPVRLTSADDGAFRGLQMLPRDGDPVVPRPNTHAAWKEVSGEVRKLCEQVHTGQPLRLAIRAALDRADACRGQIVGSLQTLRSDDHNERDALVQALLMANLPELLPLWSMKLSEVKPDPRPQTLAWVVTHALLQTGYLRREISRHSHIEAALSLTLCGLCDLSEDAVRLEAPEEALFADFMIGLAIFDALATMDVLLVVPELRVGKGRLTGKLRRIMLAEGEAVSFPRALGTSLDAHIEFLEAAESFYHTGPRDLWAEIARIFDQVDGALKGAVQRCVSLRAIPRHPGLMALEQTLHWHGWGGNGEIFEELDPHRSNNPLLREIYNHKHYAFNWYGRKDRERTGTPPPFASYRFSAFQQAALPLKEYAASCTALLLYHPALREPGRRNFACRMWGDAVGPLRATEKSVLRALEDLVSPDTSEDFRVEAVYTEVSCECLRSLEREPYAFHGKRYIVRRDLNLPFPGEPGGPGESRGEPWWPGANAFDVYVCSIALHQIVDDNHGHDRLQAVLAFATRIVRPGGVLCLPDVSDGAWLQACLLPINLVDREGHWSVDHAFGPGGRLSFLDVACSLDGAFPGRVDLARVPGDEVVKIPLPLLDFRCATPDSADDLGLPIYEFTPCVVVPMQLSNARELEHQWRHTANRAERAALGRESLLSWRSSTTSLVEDVRRIIRAARA